MMSSGETESIVRDSVQQPTVTLDNRGDSMTKIPSDHPATVSSKAKTAKAKSATVRLPDPAVTPVFRPRHPLQNSWTLWFFKNDRSRPWEDNQRPVLSVQTVEDFWAVVNHIELSSKLQAGCDYSFFKDGVKPMWEDENNRQGGRWLIKMDKKQRSAHLDNFWLEVMLCLIGESFDGYGSQVSKLHSCKMVFYFHLFCLFVGERCCGGRPQQD